MVLDQIGEFLRANTGAFAQAPLAKDQALRSILITGGVSARSKLVSLWWKGAEPLPCVVVKFPRHARYNGRLEKEYTALCALQRYVHQGSVQTPRPMGTALLGDLRVAAESAVLGRTLRAALREYPGRAERTLATLRPFVEWISGLHARSITPATPADLQRLVIAPLQGAEEALGDLSIVEQTALARLRRDADDLAANVPLPLVFTHGDVDTSNLIVDSTGGFSGLIDWESSGIGLPLQDLVYFLGRYAYEIYSSGQADQLAGFRRIFFDPVESEKLAGPPLAAAWLSQYCRAIGLAPAWLPVLFALSWLQHAWNERDTVSSLRTEGHLLYGKPAAMKTTNIDRSGLASGLFRSQLRYYLEQYERCAVLLLLAAAS